MTEGWRSKAVEQYMKDATVRTGVLSKGTNGYPAPVLNRKKDRKGGLGVVQRVVKLSRVRGKECRRAKAVFMGQCR